MKGCSREENGKGKVVLEMVILESRMTGFSRVEAGTHWDEFQHPRDSQEMTIKLAPF